MTAGSDDHFFLSRESLPRLKENEICCRDGIFYLALQAAEFASFDYKYLDIVLLKSA